MEATQIIATLVGTIFTLSGAIVILYFRGERNHRKHHELTNENLLKMTTAYTENARAQEHLANSIDDLKIVVHNKKK